MGMFRQNPMIGHFCRAEDKVSIWRTSKGPGHRAFAWPLASSKGLWVSLGRVHAGLDRTSLIIRWVLGSARGRSHAAFPLLDAIHSVLFDAWFRTETLAI